MVCAFAIIIIVVGFQTLSNKDIIYISHTYDVTLSLSNTKHYIRKEPNSQDLMINVKRLNPVSNQ